MISPATWNGCSSMHLSFITRLLHFCSFSFILVHVRAAAVLCDAILEDGVEVVINITSSMNAWSTGIDFLVDREYLGNPAWLTYSKITLNAPRTKSLILYILQVSLFHVGTNHRKLHLLMFSPKVHRNTLSPELFSLLESYTFSMQKESTRGELTYMHS